MVDDSMPSIFFKVGYITSDIQLRDNNLIPLPSALLPRLDIYIQEKIIAHSKAVLAIFNVVILTIESFKSNSVVRNLWKNWKAPGPDGVVRFWFKKVSALHDDMASMLQLCFASGKVPLWMVKSRTVLVQRDPKKETVASNYRPIACLPIMWTRPLSCQRSSS